MAGEDYTPEDAQINSRPSFNFIQSLAPGAQPATQHAVAVLVAGALVFLILVRKGFKPVLAS